MKQVKIAIFGLAAISLSGCSTTSETFDCKEGKGVGCKSISAVNKMVDQGSFGESDAGTNLTLPVPASPNNPKIQYVSGPLSDDLAINRVKEEHLRVWMAPHQDDYGNLHEGAVIHTVLKPGYWNIQGAL